MNSFSRPHAKWEMALWSIETDYNFPNTHTELIYTPVHIKGHIMACYISLFLSRMLEKILKTEELRISEADIADVLMGAFISPSEKGGDYLLSGYSTKGINVSQKLKRSGYQSMRSLCRDIFYIMDMDQLKREETVSSLRKKLGIIYPFRPDLTTTNE